MQLLCQAGWMFWLHYIFGEINVQMAYLSLSLHIKLDRNLVCLFFLMCVYVFCLAGQRERAFAGHDDPPAYASIRAKAFQPTCEFITFNFYHLILTSSDNLFFYFLSVFFFCM